MDLKYKQNAVPKHNYHPHERNVGEIESKLFIASKRVIITY